MRCYVCLGTGKVASSIHKDKVCRTCNGTGQIGSTYNGPHGVINKGGDK